jgi:hypothetical protein
LIEIQSAGSCGASRVLALSAENHIRASRWRPVVAVAPSSDNHIDIAVQTIVGALFVIFLPVTVMPITRLRKHPSYPDVA